MSALYLSAEENCILKDYYQGDDRGLAYFAAIYQGGRSIFGR